MYFINFFTDLSLSEYQNFIFLNPDKFILFSRISSLIVSSGSVIFSYLILKKLKIKSSIFFFFYSQYLYLSPIFIDVAIVGGKKCLFVIFYLVQIYFFLKYLSNPEKLTLKVYVLFAILGSLTLGVLIFGRHFLLYILFYFYTIKNIDLRRSIK